LKSAATEYIELTIQKRHNLLIAKALQ